MAEFEELPDDAQIVFDTANQVLRVRGAARQLTPKAFAVLHYLVARRGQLVEKATLLDHAWPQQHVVEGVLKKVVRELRVLLGDDAKAPRFIETVHRRGYRFVDADRLLCTGVAARPGPPCGPTASASARAVVGRARELAALSEVWRAALAGEPQGVVVYGDPGIGKTSLVADWLACEQSIASTQARLAVTRCARSTALHPHAAFLDLLTSLSASDDDGTFASCLVRCAPSWAAAAPWLNASVGETGGPPASTGALLLQAVALLEALARERPLLLVFDDSYLCDVATREIVMLLRRRHRGGRAMVLITSCSWYPCRDSEVFDSDLATGAGPWHRLTLQPLLPDSVAELVTRRDASPSAAEWLASPLHEASAGHPLLLDAVVADAWSTPARPTAGELLSTRAFARRMHGEFALLDSFERRLLQAASIALTDRVSAAAIAATLDIATLEVEAALEELGGRVRWLIPAGEREWPDGTAAQLYRFPLSIYRDFVYGTLRGASRRSLQRRHACRLERAYRGQVHVVAENLELHYRAVGDDAKVSRYQEIARGARSASNRSDALRPRLHRTEISAAVAA